MQHMLAIGVPSVILGLLIGAWANVKKLALITLTAAIAVFCALLIAGELAGIAAARAGIALVGVQTGYFAAVLVQRASVAHRRRVSSGTKQRDRNGDTDAGGTGTSKSSPAP